MTTSTSSVSGKIVLDFAWKGSNNLVTKMDVRVIDLIFKGAKSVFNVNLPQVLNLAKPEKFPFTCTRTHEGITKVTNPDTLSVTIEQVQNLILRANIFEKDSEIKSTQEIVLTLPENLEEGKSYTLEVSSENLLLTARLSLTTQTPANAPTTSYPQRVREMGGALINEGLNNLKLASDGGMNGAASSEIYAHGMEGVIRSGQKVHPGIEVPHTAPVATPEDLDTLSVADLQLRFEDTFKKDKQYESQRMRAAIAQNLQEFNKILAKEHTNSQYLIRLAEAIERKGAKPRIPQTVNFQEAARESAALQREALNRVMNALKKGNS